MKTKHCTLHTQSQIINQKQFLITREDSKDELYS